MSDTPMTDAAISHRGGNGVGVVVPVEFSRQLELERDRYKRERDELAKALLDLQQFDDAPLEYDGRIYHVCPCCNKQDEEAHDTSCSFEHARALLAALKD